MSVRAFLSVVIVSFFLFSTIPNTTYHNEYFVRDESGCKLEKSEEENNEDTATENPEDSGPVVESLEEEPGIPSLGLVAVIFSLLAIALVRRD